MGDLSEKQDMKTVFAVAAEAKVNTRPMFGVERWSGL